MAKTFPELPKLGFTYDDVDPANEYHHNETFLKAKTMIDNSNQIEIGTTIINKLYDWVNDVMKMKDDGAKWRLYKMLKKEIGDEKKSL